ncbi:ankyrin-3-like isoform X2 [Gigantopelta aegis]|nr:ankyrin-3-like isoform X2 [Gigantopelta aegis]
MLKVDDANGSVSVSPLYYSVKLKNTGIAKMLISRGADVNVGCVGTGYSRTRSETPLHCACRLGNVDIAELLLDHDCDVNAVDSDDCTPVWVAVDNKNVTMVECLLSRPGIQINVAREQPGNKEGALHKACSTGLSEIVQLLLCHGSDVNATDERNITPLYLACQNGYTNIVNVLLTAGADVNIQRNCFGWKNQKYSPLHVSIKGGHCDIVKALLAAGADIETQEATGKTGLFLACKEGHADIVKTLLDHGADPNVKTNNLGQTPLFCALHSGLYQIQKRVKQLKKSSAQGFLKYDSHSFVVEILGLLLQYGARHDLLDNSGYTACDYSIMLGQVDTTCILLQHGATITKDCYSCNTNRWDDFTICKILLLHSRDFVPLIKRNLDRVSPGVRTQVSDDLMRPPSLSRLCRYRIRNLIHAKTSVSLFPNIDILPVPNVLKKYLKLEDAYDAVFAQ